MTRLHSLTEETTSFQDLDNFYLERDIASTQIDRRASWRTIAMHFGRSTITVAATDAYSRTKQGADLICDGTADQTEINSAIASLSKGGTVRLSEGIFNITAPITNQDKDAIHLTGAGAGERSTAAGAIGTNAVGTRIFANASFTGTALVHFYRTGLDRTVANCTITNLTVDGNKANVAGTVHGIMFRGHNGLLQRLYVCNCDGDGIVIQGIDTAKGDTGPTNWDTYDTMLAQLICMDNGAAGLRYAYGSPDSHLVQGVFHSNQDGIRLQSAHHQIVSVQCYDNTRYGVYFNDHGSYTKMTNMKIEVNANHGLLIDADTVGLPHIAMSNSNFKDNSSAGVGLYNDIHIMSTGNDQFVNDPYFQGIQFIRGTNVPDYNLSVSRCQSGRFDFTHSSNSFNTAVVNDAGLACLYNGWGTNAGDPNSAGNWNTRPKTGAMVVNTTPTPNTGWVYVNPTVGWKQLF